MKKFFLTFFMITSVCNDFFAVMLRFSYIPLLMCYYRTTHDINKLFPDMNEDITKNKYILDLKK